MDFFERVSKLEGNLIEILKRMKRAEIITLALIASLPSASKGNRAATASRPFDFPQCGGLVAVPSHCYAFE
jgi:hypothetical protein